MSNDKFLSFAENASAYMLYYYSDSGDYIGGGKERLYEEEEVSFNYWHLTLAPNLFKLR